MKLSLAITTYNRYKMLLESFDKVLNDDRLSEIVIVDDCSTDGSYDILREVFSQPQYSKIKFHRNEVNVGMSLNKRKAISLCENDWVIIFDSDNVMGVDYLDAMDSFNPDELVYKHTIMMPSFAKPQFDYRKYSMQTIDRRNAKEVMADPMGNCCFNTCNMVVNRDFYLQTYQYNPDHVASDTIWHNYNHLLAGGDFYVVPNLEYFHRVHPGSGFMQNVHKNMDQSEKVRQLIMAL